MLIKRRMNISGAMAISGIIIMVVNTGVEIDTFVY